MENTIKEQSEAREQRAKSILEKGNPESVDEYTYLVPSQYSDRKYRVMHLDSYSCECEDFRKRCQGTGLYCKHIKAIILFEKVKASYDIENSPIKKELSLIGAESSGDACPYCTSKNLIKRGIRKTSTEEKQRYSCLDCERRFVTSPIKGIKVNEKYVCLAMDCYYKGLSYRDIADQFRQFYNLELSHETIRQWILQFGKVMERYAKTLTPATSGTWNADETMIRTKKGNRKEGADYEYVWNVIDHDTKFLLASVNSGHSRNIGDAKAVFQEALSQNKMNPEHIITDRNPSYQDGVRLTFRNWGAERKVKHTSIVGHRKQINNNVAENHHTHQKEFHKVRRGVNEVQSYQDGFKVFHNFIRKGVKDKQTPAERCGIGMKGNRWETLLINSLKVPNLTPQTETAQSPAE